MRVIVVLLRKKAKPRLYFLLYKMVAYWLLHCWGLRWTKHLRVTQEGHTWQTIRNNLTNHPKRILGPQSGPKWMATCLMALTVTSEDKMGDEANLKPHLINTFSPKPISFN